MSAAPSAITAYSAQTSGTANVTQPDFSGVADPSSPTRGSLEPPDQQLKPSRDTGTQTDPGTNVAASFENTPSVNSSVDQGRTVDSFHPKSGWFSLMSNQVSHLSASRTASALNTVSGPKASVQIANSPAFKRVKDCVETMMKLEMLFVCTDGGDPYEKFSCVFPSTSSVMGDGWLNCDKAMRAMQGAIRDLRGGVVQKTTDPYEFPADIIEALATHYFAEVVSLREKAKGRRWYSSRKSRAAANERVKVLMMTWNVGPWEYCRNVVPVWDRFKPEGYHEYYFDDIDDDGKV